MKRSVTVVLTAALVAFAGCVTQQGVHSLRGADPAATDMAPQAKEYLGKKPGLQEKVPRTFVGQPPLVPHNVSNFDFISVDENQCMSCHSLEKAKEKNAPPVGDSHLVTVAGKKTVGMDRYQCNTCHVPQVDAKPLVENAFVGALPAK